MTLAELFDAIEGHEEQESQRLEWSLWATRKQIFFQLKAAGVKDVKEADIIPLEIDQRMKEERMKNMPLVKITVDGVEQ